MLSKAIVLKIFSLVSQYYKTKSTQWRPKLKKKVEKMKKKKYEKNSKRNQKQCQLMERNNQTILRYFHIAISIQTRANLQQHGDKSVEERRTLKTKQLERILISLLL